MFALQAQSVMHRICESNSSSFNPDSYAKNTGTITLIQWSTKSLFLSARYTAAFLDRN